MLSSTELNCTGKLFGGLSVLIFLFIINIIINIVVVISVIINIIFLFKPIIQRL